MPVIVQVTVSLSPPSSWPHPQVMEKGAALGCPPFVLGLPGMPFSQRAQPSGVMGNGAVQSSRPAWDRLLDRGRARSGSPCVSWCPGAHHSGRSAVQPFSGKASLSSVSRLALLGIPQASAGPLARGLMEALGWLEVSYVPSLITRGWEWSWPSTPLGGSWRRICEFHTWPKDAL